MRSGIAVDRASWSRLGLLAGGATTVALWLGWQAGETPVTPTPNPPPARWAMPEKPAEDPARDLAILTARRPWTNAITGLAGAAQPGQNPGGIGAPGAPPEWRLAGIVERSDGNYVLIATGQPGSTKIEYRRVGDSLPDGSTLVDIGPDSAIARPADTAGDQRVMWLFRRRK